MKAIQRVITENVPVGKFLVTFDAIWGVSCNEGKHKDCFEHGCLDNEPSYIAEVNSNVSEITEENYLSLGESVGMIAYDSDDHDSILSGEISDLCPVAQIDAETVLSKLAGSPVQTFESTANEILKSLAKACK